jgi:DNA-binding CsgD family transcriptional regulator
MEYHYQSTGEILLLAVRYTFVPPDLVLVLTEDITKRKRDENALRMSEERFRALFRSSPLPMILFQWRNDDLVLVDGNEAATAASKGELPNLMGTPAKHIFSREPEFLNEIYDCFKRRTSGNLEYSHQFWNSDDRIFVNIYATFIPPDLFLIQAEDVTDRKHMEGELRTANEQLEADRHALVDKNVALREVLSQIKDEVNLVRQNMQSNIDKLIMPILHKLRDRSRDGERIDLDMLESLLADVASPFVREIETRFVQLTPRETEICNMIRNGLQSKEMGSSLGISVRTVEKFRQKIRQKLGVEGRDVNLTTYLRSLAQKE